MEDARIDTRRCARRRSGAPCVEWASGAPFIWRAMRCDGLCSPPIRAHCPLFLSLCTLDPTAPGTIGHVAHGKSTVVKAISGVQTVRFKTELERNITIKLGYANAKIFKCDNPKCPRPGNYKSYGSGQIAKPKCERVGCNSLMTLQRHVSFVDWSHHNANTPNRQRFMQRSEHLEACGSHLVIASCCAPLPTAPVTIF